MKVTEQIILKNETGIHARPAAQIVQILSNFSCDVSFQKGEEMADGRSIMELMMLAVASGDKINVTFEGEDADKATEAIKNLIDSNFSES